LKLKAEFLPEGEGPFEGLLNDVEWDVRAENFEKIIEVVSDMSGEMALKDPVQSFCKKIKDIRCRATAEAENYVVVEQILPGEPEKVPIGAANWDVAKCGL
jgi:hypothetical protein